MDMNQEIHLLQDEVTHLEKQLVEMQRLYEDSNTKFNIEQDNKIRSFQESVRSLPEIVELEGLAFHPKDLLNDNEQTACMINEKATLALEKLKASLDTEIETKNDLKKKVETKKEKRETARARYKKITDKHGADHATVSSHQVEARNMKRVIQRIEQAKEYMDAFKKSDMDD